MRIYIVIGFVLIMLAACLPEPLAVDGVPQLRPQMVVSSQVITDQSVVILLTKSVGALEADEDSDVEALLEQIAINDATVIISSGNFLDTLTFLEQGTYGSAPVPLTEGAEFLLRVESPSMGTVTAATRVMAQVEFQSIEARLYDNGFDTLAEVNFSFLDPPGENYYMFNVQRVTDELEVEDLLNPRLFTELFEHHGPEGQLRNANLRVFAGRDFMPNDTLAFFLSNLSKPYYNFMQLRLDSRFNFADFLGEPANYPTNITGGLGFFNLYIPDVRILRLEE
jgi:hypothetical protein